MARVHIPAVIRHAVITRANHCCEYCLLHEDDTPETHQVDHVLAIKHGGLSGRENLAYACAECNRYKGSDFATIEPGSGAIVLLFNPRTQHWHDHFALDGPRLTGLTRTGLMTIRLLQLNDERRILERAMLLAAGRYP